MSAAILALDAAAAACSVALWREDSILAVHDQRRPEFARERGRPHAADDELAVLDGGRVGEELYQRAATNVCGLSSIVSTGHFRRATGQARRP